MVWFSTRGNVGRVIGGENKLSRKKVNLNLEVHEARKDEVYKDIARISEASRKGLVAGKIHRFRTKAGSAYLILRGNDASLEKSYIRLDEAARDRLGLSDNDILKNADFTVSEVGLRGEFVWAWQATDPSYRVAARLGVLSIVLAVFSVLPLGWSILVGAARILLWIADRIAPYFCH
jgi:hypothetical protein